MEDNLLQRAYLLFQHNRLAESALVLQDLLRKSPNHVEGLALYAEIKLEQESYSEALQLIDSAIGLRPDIPDLYYTKSRVMLGLEKYDEAEELLQTALQINPIDADYYALWASIKLARKQFEKALELANKALELDAENLLGLNIRSGALMKLNQKEASFQTIEGALRQNPNDSYTHANYGWNLLEKGEHKKALEHFREALRSNPNNEYAQSGMLEALKAKYFIYRIFLQYSFWMSNLSERHQWAFLIGFYIAQRILSSAARNNPALEPFLTPILIVLALVAFSTWVIVPISNLLLRLNVYGKYLLKKEALQSSNFVGASFVVFAIGLLAYIVLQTSPWLALMFFGLSMMLPCSVMFDQQKNTLKMYAAGMFVVGGLAIGYSFMNGELFNIFTSIYVLGFVAFQWVANYSSIRASNF